MIARVLTAAVGIPVLAFAALSESLWPVRILAVALFALGSLEIARSERDAPRLLMFAFVLLFALCAFMWDAGGGIALAIGAIVCNIIFWFEVLGDRGSGIGRAFSTLLLQVAWLGFPLLLLIVIRAHDTADEALLSLSQGSVLMLLLICIWACDSLAFFVGRSIGKRKLAPTISPNKTWEGAIAGVLAAVAAGMLIGIAFHIELIHSLLIGAIAGILGQLGDLFQSAWKRSLGLKDSGALLPGHGGVLDRFDSLLYCAPATALVIALV